jgi:transglutaminase-like putative cysteine protease
MKFFITLFVLVCSLLITTTPIHAQTAVQDNFSTSVATTYTVKPDGATIVTHNFTITNKTPTTYLKQYALQTTSKDLKNISAKSEDIVLQPAVSEASGLTTIALDFPTEVVGEGKRRQFGLSYEVGGLATVGGSVLEVKLPKLSTAENFAERSVTIITPLKFGGPVRSSKQPDSTKVEGHTFVASFPNLGNEALSLFYGDSQVFKMTLRYNLENPSNTRGLAQIALPPDTQLQKMSYHELDPLPQKMKRDDDGNWIATYELAPQTATTVYLTAYARLTLERNALVPESAVLPAYTQSDRYWEVQNAEIKKRAVELKTPEAIFTDILTKFSYSETRANLETIERFGAVKAFEQPLEAICQEYADAFIATARAANIPARRLTGYAYTQDNQSRPLSLAGDVLHAWAEYYNAETQHWVPVDPTWQDTTGGVDYFNQFDLNHLVFAINGSSSTTPFPAGSYKTSNPSQDVDVSFADSFPTVTPKITIIVTPRKVLGIAIPGLHQLTITNTTGQAWYDVPLSYSELNQEVALVGSIASLPALLPFQTISVPLHIQEKSFLKLSSTKLIITTTIQGTDSRYEKNATTGPAYIASIFDSRFLPYLGAGLVVSTLAAGSVLVFRPKR